MYFSWVFVNYLKIKKIINFKKINIKWKEDKFNVVKFKFKFFIIYIGMINMLRFYI